jgi:ferrous iron transport protein B
MSLSAPSPSVAAARHRPTKLPLYALVGNPNCGKTTVFNALTGLRQKVGNYPGVTVEKKEGRLLLPDGDAINLIDLPGLYSLTPRSPDEAIARDVLFGHRKDVAQPDGIIHVVDASNLERNLYLTSQLLDLGLPTVIVLTMTDIAERTGQTIDIPALEQKLGVPIQPVVASANRGLSGLRDKIQHLAQTPVPAVRGWSLPKLAEEEVVRLSERLQKQHNTPPMQSVTEAIGLLMQERLRPEEYGRWSADVLALIRDGQAKFDTEGLDFPGAVVQARYEWARQVCADVLKKPMGRGAVTLTDKLDRIFMHPFWGYLIFFGVMAFVFQTIFTWANVPMNWIGSGVGWLQNFVTAHMPAGPLQDLLVNGIIAGVGTTLTFLPQILLLFFFIALLEDTGYMARAAFLMDKVMSKVGLHGKSFIPLLSSFACAIPGIMATRTIDDRKSRLVTILVAPLMSCSARIPVYTLMIAAFIPARRVVGIFTLPGLTMLVMYFLGTVAAFGMAWLFKKTLLKGQPPVFFLEMPPYHKPSARTVLMAMLERALLFLKRAGTLILSMSVILWFLSTYPHLPAKAPALQRLAQAQATNADAKTLESLRDQAGQQQLAYSAAGRAGHFLEPVIAPIGFDWRIGVSLVSSFVAREVFVSSMGTIYSVADRNSDPDQVAASLKDKLRADPFFSPLLAVCVMVYYVLAMQCLSTVAVVKRETNGWKWPLFMTGYMTALAWGATFLVYHIGLAFGWGVR